MLHHFRIDIACSLGGYPLYALSEPSYMRHLWASSPMPRCLGAGKRYSLVWFISCSSQITLHHPIDPPFLIVIQAHAFLGLLALDLCPCFSSFDERASSSGAGHQRQWSLLDFGA